MSVKNAKLQIVSRPVKGWIGDQLNKKHTYQKYTFSNGDVFCIAGYQKPVPHRTAGTHRAGLGRLTGYLQVVGANETLRYDSSCPDWDSNGSHQLLHEVRMTDAELRLAFAKSQEFGRTVNQSAVLYGLKNCNSVTRGCVRLIGAGFKEGLVAKLGTGGLLSEYVGFERGVLPDWWKPFPDWWKPSDPPVAPDATTTSKILQHAQQDYPNGSYWMVGDRFFVKSSGKTRAVNQSAWEEFAVKQLLRTHGKGMETKARTLALKRKMVDYHKRQDVALHRAMAYREALRKKQNVEMARRRLQASFKGLEDLCGFLGQIGGKVGQIGQIGAKVIGVFKTVTNLVQNAPNLLSSFGGGGLGFLGFLSPVCGILSGGLALLGMFRKKKSGGGLGKALQAIMGQLQAISAQIHALHQDMIRHFQQVYRNQQRIIDTILTATEQLNYVINQRADDVIEASEHYFHDVRDRLSSMHEELRLGIERLKLEPLQDAIDQVKDLLSQESMHQPGANDSALRTHLVRIGRYLVQDLASSVYNGRDFYGGKTLLSLSTVPDLRNYDGSLSGVSARDEVLFDSARKVCVSGILGYLAECAAKSVPDAFPVDCDPAKLVNSELWLGALWPYLNVRQHFFSSDSAASRYDTDFSELSKLFSSTQNSLSFVRFLQNSPAVYRVIFSRCFELLDAIRDRLQDQIVRLCARDLVKPRIDALTEELKTVNLRLDDGYRTAAMGRKSGHRQLYERSEVVLRQYLQSLEQHKDRVEEEYVCDIAKLFAAVMRTEGQLSMDDLCKIEFELDATAFAAPASSLSETSRGYEPGIRVLHPTDHLFRAIAIPKVFVLAEKLGVVKFEVETQQRNTLPPGWCVHNGLRLRDEKDRYNYHIKIHLIVNSSQRKVLLYEFDAQGHIENDPKTAQVAPLLDEMSRLYTDYVAETYLPGGDQLGYYYNQGVYAGAATRTALSFPSTDPVVLKGHDAVAKADVRLLLASDDPLMHGLRMAILSRIASIKERELQAISLPGSAWVSVENLLKQLRRARILLLWYMQVAGFPTDLIDEVGETLSQPSVRSDLRHLLSDGQAFDGDHAGRPTLQERLTVLQGRVLSAYGVQPEEEEEGETVSQQEGTTKFSSKVEVDLQEALLALRSLHFPSLEEELRAAETRPLVPSRQGRRPRRRGEFPVVVVDPSAALQARSPSPKPDTSSQEIPFTDLTIGSVIGRGGFGVVSEAIWNWTPPGSSETQAISVAVKDITLQFGVSDALIREEVKKMVALQGSHVVKVYGVCFNPEMPDSVMVVMERMDGNLHDYLRRNGPVNWRQKLSLLHKMAVAVSRLLSQNVIHRDLKASNFLFRGSGPSLVVKVGDFGCSRIHDKSATFLTTGIVGTGLWHAPEILQALDPAKVHFSRFSDIYALAIAFYEVLFECLPYAGLNPTAVQTQVILQQLRPDLTRLVGKKLQVPQVFQELLKRMWAQDPSSRITIQLVLSALRRIASQQRQVSKKRRARLEEEEGEG